MDRIITVIEVVAPIFLAVALGMIARKRSLIKPEEVRGFQQFVMNFGLPCVVFRSCLTAEIGVDCLSTMGLVLPMIIGSTIWALKARRKMFPYRNLPMLFSAQETGMLGIPLYMILFGADQAYRVGMLDLTQAVTAYPIIALLSSNVDDGVEPKEIVKSIVKSPLLILSVIGLVLNLTGISRWMLEAGVRGILTESTGFLSQPISALMLFSVGYNFSMDRESRTDIFRIAGIHFAGAAAACVVMELILLLIPGVDNLSRWAILLYCILPGSYLSTGLGRTEKESAVASGVCSVLTVTCLAAFCVMAAVLA